MPTMPYQVIEEVQPELKVQIYKLIQNLYSDDVIGAADIGDVFTTSHDVLTLNLHETSGLQKTNNLLSIAPKSDGGLQVVGNDGFSVKTANGTINLSGDGMKAPSSTGFISGIASVPPWVTWVEVEEPAVRSTSLILTTFMGSPMWWPTTLQDSTYATNIIEGQSFLIELKDPSLLGVLVSWCIIN